MINTAKLHGVDPRTYLADALDRIVSGRTKVNALRDLLPWKWLGGSRCDGAGRRLMQRSSPRHSRSGASEMSLEQLNAWLATLDPPPRVDGASMLDGYLTAIVIGPCSIPPDERFVDLLGVRGRIAVAAGTALAAIAAVIARFNAIGEGLATAPTRHGPIFEKTDDGMALPQPWCMGFAAGMRLRCNAWQPLLDLKRIDYGLLLPILLYYNDPSGAPLLGSPRDGLETEQSLRTAYQDIPLVIPAIREFWMPNRVSQATRQN